MATKKQIATRSVNAKRSVCIDANRVILLRSEAAFCNTVSYFESNWVRFVIFGFQNGIKSISVIGDLVSSYENMLIKRFYMAAHAI